ncbi:hypothetical protein HYALB_00004126 [Hymenoscyphus albidus]|uniref:Cyclin-domain-containing protein n=1 Tax=Hymenoscyphus albidus TaxID=595503 RepID=A0A9N9Q001_9HELO|nr:hypothetical protein HYALB_00004126 [Hymenoscyphus albidus]
MAAVISDYGSDFGSDTTRSHYHRSLNMRSASGQQRCSAESTYRQSSRVEPPSPRPHPSTTTDAVGSSPCTRSTQHDSGVEIVEGKTEVNAGQQPSPPLSSSPQPTSHIRTRFPSQENMARNTTQSQRSPYDNPALRYESLNSATQESATQPPLPRPVKSSDDVKGYIGNPIKVRDLAHIQALTTEEHASGGGMGRRRAADDSTPKYEISGMPITDIIEMVAGLLTKMTTTNDQQQNNVHRPLSSGDPSANMSTDSSSVLAFHGKNVPSITILSYLSRIHKYCPTTYEVFLSLLVYFERMTERVNASLLQNLRRDSSVDQENTRPSTGSSSSEADSPPTTSRSVPEMDADFQKAQYTHTPAGPSSASLPLSPPFIVDSFNIHRLVIAGVTCASKFFSDVFYTNSRYAKVGGLPLAELNHLELQFLLLNDFRLSISVEELEAYGTMLVEFYAREVIAQRNGSLSATSQMAYADEAAAPGPTSP